MRLPAGNRREPSPKLKHATACFKLRKTPTGRTKKKTEVRSVFFMARDLPFIPKNIFQVEKLSERVVWATAICWPFFLRFRCRHRLRYCCSMPRSTTWTSYFYGFSVVFFRDGNSQSKRTALTLTFDVPIFLSHVFPFGLRTALNLA